MIELKNVSRCYYLGGEEIRALNQVSLTVEDGSFLALVGPSGSGKSTLLNLLGGLDRPDHGEILVDGQAIHKLSDKQLARYRREKIGFVFQTFHLIPAYTTYENVILPLQFTTLPGKEKQDRALAALKTVGLADRLRHRPNQLSGGQQQRVAIARALVNHPQIILADEPTGNLDSKNGAEIVNFLKGLSQQGITIVMVTHNLEMAAKAKRTVRLKDGKIV
ncbi:ABC transporter ATP-binding protein [candidate division CPR3 bacterium 4484_211]|uniref:ABC transporter ATP-binding protein n=1 Tax=candidate division CPR3 bacterium 4484_211 TaxID=1968527 RepID=A0A1W9NXG3_UNCC3|nr:MAG: ABC transporter ATP-binding protein [candidate division CPR3 bacterium 4484_211]